MLFPISDIDDILPGLLESRERVYYAMGKWPDFDRQVMDWVNVLRANARAGAHPPGEFLDLDHLLHDLRLYKSAAELRVMRAAACISAEAHMRAMAKCRPGMMEYELEAEYLYAFGAAGAQHPAYSSIVGAGVNGCILHYVENDSMIRDGDLVLLMPAASLIAMHQTLRVLFRRTASSARRSRPCMRWFWTLNSKPLKQPCRVTIGTSRTM